MIECMSKKYVRVRTFLRGAVMFDFLQEGLFERLFPGGAVPTENSWLYYLTFIGFALAVIVISYLLGSVNTAIVVSKAIYHDDIRKHGSGNAGLTNMLRTYGKGAAGLTLLGDILKTAISILIAGVLWGFAYVCGISTGLGFCYVAGLFAVLGHIFPIYYKFKGGKGVLATATMALILSPAAFAVLLLVFIIIVAISKYVSLGSVTGAIFYPVSLYVYIQLFFADGTPLPLLAALSSIILAVIIVWCHRENLERISNRTERKLSFKKKPEIESLPKDEDGEADDEE